MSKKFDWKNAPSGEGKVAIVTGANVGLGFETAKVLAAKNYHVIMACRKEVNANEAMEKIRSEHSSASLEFLQLDLASHQNVRAFATAFTASQSRLDLLINNAGVMQPPYQKTEDGFELQFGVNYLSHFLLTGLLMEVLAATEHARIVTLSSLVHRQGKINFDDLQSEKTYDKGKAYGQSKLACLMFAYELQRKLDEHNVSVQSLAAHPGISLTNLIRHYPKWVVSVSSIFMGILIQDAESGALPTVRAAIDPEAKGGEYYGPGGFNEFKGRPIKVKSTKLSHDRDIASKLWGASEKLADIEFEATLSRLGDPSSE